MADDETRVGTPVQPPAGIAPDTVQVDVEMDDDLHVEAKYLRGYRKRRVRLEFGGAYKGLWVEVWANCPRGLIKRLIADDQDKVDQAFCEFVLDHNLVDDSGEPMPNPLTVAAVEAIDQPTYVKIIKAGIEKIQELAGVSKS